MSKMRLRFAPSPTGALHIGGVRTAMYNYLLAKKMGGTFILRVEDTDQNRYVEGAEQYIQDALKWLNIEPDESPTKGGDYGPYRQSERKHLYRKYADQLIDSGNAYYAFDTSEELNVMRESYDEKGETFTYNGGTRGTMRNSLSLSEDEVENLLKNDVPYVIRFKMPAKETLVFSDIVRDEMEVETELLDDKVLFKSDGMPTYHLANIVDDHLMEITHVIRGEEWLPSLPLHVLLYRAFNWDAPLFAHLPLILKPNPASYINKKSKENFTNQFVEGFLKGMPEYAEQKSKVVSAIQTLLQDVKGIQDKLKVKEKDSNLLKATKEYLKSVLFGKLSKRDGDRLGIPVFPLDWDGGSKDEQFKGFKSFGFMPEASLNFLAFLGWNPGSDQEIFKLDDLSQAFSLENINKSGARFDFNKAKWYNKQYIMASENSHLAKLIKPLFSEEIEIPSEEYFLKLIGLLKERVNFLPDFVDQGKAYLQDSFEYDMVAIGKKWDPEFKHKFLILINELNSISSFEIEDIEKMIESFMENNSISMGQLFPLLRLSLIGTMHGPGVFEMIKLIGKSKTVLRIEAFLQMV